MQLQNKENTINLIQPLPQVADLHHRPCTEITYSNTMGGYASCNKIMSGDHNLSQADYSTQN